MDNAFARADTLRAVGISGSPSDSSKSRVLLRHALERLAEHGAAVTQVDLAALPAEALLGRGTAPEVEAAGAAVAAAHIVVASTPVYRASYSGLLKVFFDLLPPGTLAGKLGVPIATGGVPGHLLALDHGLRPLFASLGALVVPTGTYGTDTQFQDGIPHASLLARIDRAVAEAVALAGAGGAAGIAPFAKV